MHLTREANQSPISLRARPEMMNTVLLGSSVSARSMFITGSVGLGLRFWAFRVPS